MVYLNKLIGSIDYKLLAACIAAVSFVVGVILFKIFIPYLRKVKLGQKILEIGPSWHKSKEGTPNLGGVIFIISMLVAVLIGIALYGPKTLEYPWKYGNFYGIHQIIVVLLFALSQALIGFVDDYVKLFKKRNKGLSATQKFIFQFATAGGFLFYYSYFVKQGDTSVMTPWGNLELGIFYYVIMLLAIVYIINCANLTDGIDGLAGSTALIITFMLLIFSIKFMEKDNTYSFTTGLYITSAALIGALLAFLVFNFHPAKIFMGDTGSLFLGGFVVASVMMHGSELVLIPISCIWIIEGLSVMLQVASFKITGKRIFKMAPIHHHFEKCGWGEVKIVAIFSLVTVIFSVLSYYLLNIITLK